MSGPTVRLPARKVARIGVASTNNPVPSSRYNMSGLLGRPIQNNIPLPSVAVRSTLNFVVKSSNLVLMSG